MEKKLETLHEIRHYFAGKRVLITGGCGFIGSHLASLLSQWGANVRLFDRHTGYVGQDEFIQGDVRDYEALERAARKCDIVLHFAALLGVERILNHPKDVLDINLQGTINTLEAAKRNDVECFVFASSSEIYGEPRKIPVSEDTPPSPASIYGTSKLAAEAYCSAYAHTVGIRSVRLRFFNVYGPNQAREFVIPRFMYRIASDRPPVIYGSGEQIRAYTYISDAVHCALLATACQNGVDEVFNVGSEEVMTVAELAHLSIEISGKQLTPEYKSFGDSIRPADREIYTRIPDTAKAAKVLGFRSQVCIREGLSRCYEWVSLQVDKTGDEMVSCL